MSPNRIIRSSRFNVRFSFPVAALSMLFGSFAGSFVTAQTAPAAPTSSAPSAAPIQNGQAGTVSVPATSPNGQNTQNTSTQNGTQNQTQNGSRNSNGQNTNSPNENRTTNDATRQQDQTDRSSDTNRPIPPTPETITEFQRLVAESTGQQLGIFGANLFNGPSTFAPVTDIPISPDYVIGPGDEIRVQVFGQVNEQDSFVVDRSGNISFQNVGQLHVMGLKFSQLQSYLKSQLGRFYRNFDLTVNLGALRSIQIYITGSTVRPGNYTVSSLATLLNALFVSGGPLPQGSLRDIQLKRGNKTITHFDLYDLLLHGDKSKDVPLEPGDIIFIPPVGAQVAISGSVDNPAIYEILPGTTVNDTIALAGGETAVALGTQVRLERIYEHSMRALADVDLSRYNPVLQNGDIVEVGQILGRYRNAITLRGNVAAPGRYVFKPGMRITDLVPNKDQLITRQYYARRNAQGTAPIAGVPGTASLQVGGSGATVVSDVAVQSGSSSSTASGGSSVASALTGSNGIFPPVTDVFLSAPDIDWSYAVIERLDQATLTTSLIPFVPGKLFLDGDQSQNLELQSGDIVTFFSTADIKVPTIQQTRFVRLEGEFIAAGFYSVLPGETLHHLLQRAGGFTPDAYLYGSEFTRQSTRRVQQQRLNEFADSIESQIATQTSAANSRAVSTLDTAAIQVSAQQAYQTVARLRRVQPIGRIVLELKPDSRGIDAIPDLPLEDGDRFVVPRIPSTVAVEGQVYSANAFLWVRGRRERDYLHQAGGPDRDADTKRAFILRADGSVFSHQYGDVDRATMFPGDTIVIPPKLDRRAILRNLIDVASVVGGLGVGIAAIDLIR